MKYAATIIIIIIAIRTISFAIYNWKNKNKMAAVGSIIAALLASIFPIVLMFIRG